MPHKIILCKAIIQVLLRLWPQLLSLRPMLKSIVYHMQANKVSGRLSMC